MNELVSVVVVSYNASKTIKDTLDSVFNQSYEDIELIISDDASKDETADVVRSWLNSHNYRFKRVVLNVNETNKGVCGNLNVAVDLVTSRWMKCVAADDMLLPNCIRDNMEFVNSHPSCEFVCSLQRVYDDVFDEEHYARTVGSVCEVLVNENVNEQLRRIAYDTTISAPTTFMSKLLIDSIGGFDENYVYEDHPLYVNLLEHGFRIFYMPIETVCYRIHSSTFNSPGRLFNMKFVEHAISFRASRCNKYLGRRQVMALNAKWSLVRFLDRNNLNNRDRWYTPIIGKLFGILYYLGK